MTGDETTIGAEIEAKFNHSEYRAWKCGDAFKSFVESQLPADYRKNVIAHSLGNVVVGSALANGLRFDRWALLNGAMPAQCFDPDPSLKQLAANQVFVTEYWNFNYAAWNGGDLGDDPLGWIRSQAYRNRTGAVAVGATKLVNFYLADDLATTNGWEANQWGAADLIPEIPGFISNPDSKIIDGYDYEIGSRLSFYPLGSGDRVVGDSHEAMSMVNQSMTKAVGAEGLTGGSISGDVDMDGAGMGFVDEHEAVFKYVPHRTWVVYEQLLVKLGYHPNP